MITKEQQAELRKKARAANERIRKASGSAQRAYEHYTRKYHTYTSKKGERLFRTGAAKTEAEFRQRMRELDDFLKSDYTTKSGWQKSRKRGLSKAIETLENMGYDVTEEELANIIQETGGSSQRSAAFYRALENLTIEKLQKRYSEMKDEEFEEEIAERRTDQQAAEALIKARKERTEKILKNLKRAGRKKKNV